MTGSLNATATRFGAVAAAVNRGGSASATREGPELAARFPAPSDALPAAASYDRRMSGAVPETFPDRPSSTERAPCTAGLLDTDRPAESGPDSGHAAAGSAPAPVSVTGSLNVTAMRSGDTAAARRTGGRASATRTGPAAPIRLPAASAAPPAAPAYDRDMFGAVPETFADRPSTAETELAIAGLRDTDRPAADGPDSTHAADGSASSGAETGSVNVTAMLSGAVTAAANWGGMASATRTGPSSAMGSPARSDTPPAAATYDRDMFGAVPETFPDRASSTDAALSIAGLRDTDRPAADGPDRTHAADGSASSGAETGSVNVTAMRSCDTAVAEATEGRWPSAACRPAAPGNEWWLLLPRSAAMSTVAVSSSPAGGPPNTTVCSAVPDPARDTRGGRPPDESVRFP